MRRRRCLTVLGALAAPFIAGPAAAQEVPTLVFLGFELVDDQPDAQRDAAYVARLQAITQQLREGLAAQGLYRLRDEALQQPAARAALDAARAQGAFLYRCNGCLGAVGDAAGAQLVGVGWVQRVSNLILNINLEIRAARDDRLVLTKSVDIRGDNDVSLRRGVAFMLRDMAERRARQPAYGV